MYLLLTENERIIIGLIFLGVLALSLGTYIAWNIKPWDKNKGKKIRRAAKEDLKLVRRNGITVDQLADRVRAMVPSLLTANSVLAAIMIAAVFIIVSQIVFESNYALLHGLKGAILIAAFTIAAIAALSWLFVIEQLTQIIAPSATTKKVIRFHIYNYDLWFYSLFLIVIDIYLFLLLVDLVAALVTGFVIFWIIRRYWKIHNEW